MKTLSTTEKRTVANHSKGTEEFLCDKVIVHMIEAPTPRRASEAARRGVKVAGEFILSQGLLMPDQASLYPR